MLSHIYNIFILTRNNSYNNMYLLSYFFRVPARPESLKNANFDTHRSNSDSVSSSSEILNNPDEPYYDMVAPEEEYLARSDHSSTENVFGSSSTLPLDLKTQHSIEPQSPGTSNYVNIEYFIQWVLFIFLYR